MMKHRDLGDQNGALLLFGGPYSNLQATHAVLQAAAARGLTPGQMICTGDVVAYCGDPCATVDLLREAGISVVAGNCEKQLAAGAMDCGCGFEEGTACDLLSAGWFSHASRKITAAQRDWMGSLPDIASFHHAGKRYAVIHGGATDIARFIWESSSEEVFATEWRAVEAAIGPIDGVIAGHSGVPFIRETRLGIWINAGVIGMPPHDGSAMTRYATLENGRAEIHTLSYDVDGAVHAMTQAGLTQGYHDALTSGYWPSEDVLPLDLRCAASDRG